MIVFPTCGHLPVSWIFVLKYLWNICRIVQNLSLDRPYIYIHSIVTTCPYRLRCPPSWLWPKFNRLLRLDRTQSAVTLPRWCERWYIWACSNRRGLKPQFYRLPRPWLLWVSSPARENSHGRTRNRTRYLMASSHMFWPPSHEAGHIYIYRRV
jgi:hypothetical protein